MSAVIRLPTSLYERLVQKSRQLERTPENVVADLLQHYLGEADERWQAELQALLTRIQARAAAFPSDEIEADITLASAEARELRRARRPA